MYLIPNSASQPEPVNERHEDAELREYTTKSGRHVEIHSDKWHRCIGHVKKRGGPYNPYAVCTASIGKAGSFAKGHGGRAKPKGAPGRHA